MDQNIDFAFEGFRIIRQKPILILFWGLASLLLSGMMQWISMSMLAPIMDQMMAMSSTTGTASAANVSAQLGLIGKILPLYGLILVGSMVYYAVMNCAAFRAVLGSQDSSFGYLRLGGDELRQMLVMFLFFLLCFVAYIVVVIIVVVLGGIMVAAMAGNANGSPMGGVMVGLVFGLAILCIVIWFAVRMSFYTVHSFATKKIDLFGSWQYTKGRFWILFAGYLVTFIMAMVVALLFIAIFMGVAAALGMNGMSLFTSMAAAGQKVSYASLYGNPLMIGYTLFTSFFVTPLMVAMFAGAPAAAYRNVTGRTLMAKAEHVF